MNTLQVDTSATAGRIEPYESASWDSLTIVERWLNDRPDVRWTKVVIDRNDGMTLTSSDGALELHLRCANCGYNGTGPITSAEILELLGFGRRKDLQDQLLQPYVEFRL